MRRAAVVALLALAGCGSTPAPPAVSGPAASCADPSPIAVGNQGPEITGRGRGAQLHGLIMVPRYPIAAGRSTVKIVWRMTGSGYRFPRPGCYRLTARRTVGSAEAWLRVRA